MGEESETITCWSCQSSIPRESSACPYCEEKVMTKWRAGAFIFVVYPIFVVAFWYVISHFDEVLLDRLLGTTFSALLAILVYLGMCGGTLLMYRHWKREKRAAERV